MRLLTEVDPQVVFSISSSGVKAKWGVLAVPAATSVELYRSCGLATLNVSHFRASPLSKPRRNQRMRCALVP